ncbi:SPOR domain-containing protein, partial [Pseudomonas sp. A-1]
MSDSKKEAPRGASRTPPPSTRQPVPGWIWLACGAAIGGFLVFLAQLEPKRDEARRAPAEAAAKPAAPAAPQRPRFEFYEELTKASPAPLPGEQPTPEQVQAAEAARAQALLEGRTPPPRLVVAPQPA